MHLFMVQRTFTKRLFQPIPFRQSLHFLYILFSGKCIFLTIFLNLYDFYTCYDNMDHYITLCVQLCPMISYVTSLEHMHLLYLFMTCIIMKIQSTMFLSTWLEMQVHGILHACVTYNLLRWWWFRLGFFFCLSILAQWSTGCLPSLFVTITKFIQNLLWQDVQCTTSQQ